MAAVLPMPEDLPSRPASHVKNRWGEVARQVRKSGSVSVTNHAKVEMVLIDAATYRRLAQEMGSVRAREEAVMAGLDRAFEARLAVLQAPDARARVDGLFASRGKLKRLLKAGTSF